MDDTKQAISNFWDENPCGSKFIKDSCGAKEFFMNIEKIRYSLEPHILDIISAEDVPGKKVLEVGCGLGTDGAQFAKRGAEYFAIDLAKQHIELSKKRFDLFELQGDFRIADAENLPFAENNFDIVYSHGVLHHTPDTQKAIDEIYRVLKTGGKAVVMLYHKNSYNYHINIMLLRRLGIFMLYLPMGVNLISKLTGEEARIFKKHKENLEKQGLKYLRAKIFLNYNTDGPGNPISKVYDKDEARNMFSKFKQVKTEIRYLNKRWIPLLGRYIPKRVERVLEKLWGWHLYIIAEK